MSSSNKNLPGKELCGRCLSVSGSEPHTPYTLLHVYKVYLFTHGKGEGKRVEPERRVTVHKAGSKNSNVTDCISSL